ncbi:MAG: ABC transporter permease, partial [Nanoarchaeota archaeon]
DCCEITPKYNSIQKYSYTASIPSDKNQRELIYKEFSMGLADGKLLDDSSTGKVVLGDDFTDENKFKKQIRVGSKIKIEGKDFIVAGILKKSSSFQVNMAILMLEDDMKSLLDLNNQYDFIAVQVSDKNKLQDIADELTRKFRQDRHEKLGEESFTVQSPLQALGAINTILNIINIIVSGIAAISLIVGGLGIANTMYTSVLERTKEIGTMKAVGAKNKDILYIFVIESGLLGLVGGIIGVIIGLGMAFIASIAVNTYFESQLFTPQINFTLIIGAILFSFILGIGFGILPALQASKLKPVEALRK